MSQGRFDADYFNQYIRARNPETSLAELEELARSKIAKIRLAVAENPHAGQALLYRLAKDKDCDVSHGAILNLNECSDKILKIIKNANLDLRLSLSYDIACPKPILAYLALDDNPYVSHMACQTLNKLKSENSQSKVYKFKSQTKVNRA